MQRYREGRRDLDIGTVLRVPNDEPGLSFIEQLRGYSVRGVKIRVRPRGPRARYAQQVQRSKRSLRQDCPREVAEYFAVYVDKRTKRNQAETEMYWRLWEQAKRVPELEKEMVKLAAEVQAKGLFREPEPTARLRKFRFDE
jgi:hypothetical protein